MSLNGRLKRAKSITVHADVTVAALMGGQFGGLHVVGQRWTTPLNLTADRVEVRECMHACTHAVPLNNLGPPSSSQYQGRHLLTWFAHSCSYLADLMIFIACLYAGGCG